MIFIQKRDKCVSFIRHEKLHTVQTIWQLMLSLKNDCILLSLYISRKGHVAYNRKCGTKFQPRVPYSGKKINFLTATNK